MASDRSKLAVLIVSYGSAQDVDRCLRSLALSDYENFEIFICENGGQAAFSRVERIIANGAMVLERVPDGLDPLDEPAGRLIAVTKGRLRGRTNVARFALATDNLGYGGGVNAWLERLLESPCWEAVLVLNPDTEVDKSCLSQLMAKAEEGFGMIGATLVFDDAPDKIINYGLQWSRLTGRVIAVGRNAVAGSRPTSEVLSRIDAISGACVLVTRAFIEDVGLMAEDYFLYIEDLDWGRRRGRHRIGFAEKAVVRHVGGTTIGSAVDPKKSSYLSIYLSARNGMVYARRWAGWRWVIHFGFALLYAARFMTLGAPDAARISLMGLMDGVKGKTGKPDFTFDAN